jgi:hypothetical protein
MKYHDPVGTIRRGARHSLRGECWQARRRIPAASDVTVEGLQSMQPALFKGLLTAQ